TAEQVDRKSGHHSWPVQVACVVPQPDRRFGKVVLVAEQAKSRGAKQQIPSARRFEAEPARGEYAPDVGARKQQHITACRAYTADDAVGPCADLVRGFPARAAVAEQLPIRPPLEDLGGAPAFILTIVPFGQILILLGYRAEPCQLAGLG